MSKGRFDEAEKIIRDVARVNKAKLPEILFEEHEKQEVIINFYHLCFKVKILNKI